MLLHLKLRSIITCFLIITGLTGEALAFVHIGEPKRVTFDIWGNTFLQTGEIIWPVPTIQQNGDVSFSEKNRVWSHATGGRLILRSTFLDKVYLNAAVDGTFQLDVYQHFPDDGGISFQFKLFNTNVEFLTGTPEKISLGIKAGFFNFRYNSEIKNLGEYLIRSSTSYSFGKGNLIRTEFENEGQDLLGIDLSNDLSGHFHQDLLMYFSSEVISDAHMNFAYVVNGHSDWGLSMGMGFKFDPRAQRQIQMERIDSTYFDGTTRYDTSTFYGSGRIRFEANACFDIKRTFPECTFFQLFGKEDLKLYGEIAGIGYNYFDGTMMMPFTFGVNVPGFKILWDVLSLELEYFKGNARSLVYGIGAASDTSLIFSNYTTKTTESDTPWRWSIFCSRTVVSPKVNILMLVARDHYRDDLQYNYLDEKGCWHWILKVRYDF